MTFRIPYAFEGAIYTFIVLRENRCIDRWGKRAALSLEPLEIEQWLKALKQEEDLANPTLDKIRRVMSLVFKHGQRYV